MSFCSQERSLSREGGLCPGRGSLSREGVSVQGGESLSREGVSVHRGLFPKGGSLSTGGLSLKGGVSVQKGGLCPGWFLYNGVGGGFCPGGEVSVGEIPPYGNVRAVRILLECILVVILPAGHCPVALLLTKTLGTLSSSGNWPPE